MTGSYAALLPAESRRPSGTCPVETVTPYGFRVLAVSHRSAGAGPAVAGLALDSHNLRMKLSRDRVPASERLLMEALDDHPAQSVLCTSLGRGQLAGEASRHWPAARIVCH